MVDQCICGGKANLQVAELGMKFWEDFFHRTPSPIRVLPSCCNNYTVLIMESYTELQSYQTSIGSQVIMSYTQPPTYYRMEAEGVIAHSRTKSGLNIKSIQSWI